MTGRVRSGRIAPAVQRGRASRGVRAGRLQRATQAKALGDVVAARGWQLADSALARLVGWMGRRTVGPEAGLCLVPCRAIHTFFMRFPIDVLFLASDGTVLRRIDGLPPRRAARHPGAFAVLELPAGVATTRGLVVGRKLDAQAGCASASIPP